jgi:hypothetical protein
VRCWMTFPDPCIDPARPQTPPYGNPLGLPLSSEYIPYNCSVTVGSDPNRDTLNDRPSPQIKVENWEGDDQDLPGMNEERKVETLRMTVGQGEVQEERKVETLTMTMGQEENKQENLETQHEQGRLVPPTVETNEIDRSSQSRHTPRRPPPIQIPPPPPLSSDSRKSSRKSKTHKTKKQSHHEKRSKHHQKRTKHKTREKSLENKKQRTSHRSRSHSREEKNRHQKKRDRKSDADKKHHLFPMRGGYNWDPKHNDFKPDRDRKQHKLQLGNEIKANDYLEPLDNLDLGQAHLDFYNQPAPKETHLSLKTKEKKKEKKRRTSILEIITQQAAKHVVKPPAAMEVEAKDATSPEVKYEQICAYLMYSC